VLGKTVGDTQIYMKISDSLEIWRVLCFIIFKKLVIFRKHFIEMLKSDENVLELENWN